MQSRSFPVILVVLIVAIAVVNGLADIYYWYWHMRWFDIPMHFAGGVWLAGVAVWWRYSGHKGMTISFLQIFAVCILAALGIGLLWEMFEAWLSFVTTGYINAMPDTLKDLFFDTMGGTAVSVLAWLKMKQN